MKIPLYEKTSSTSHHQRQSLFPKIFSQYIFQTRMHKWSSRWDREVDREKTWRNRSCIHLLIFWKRKVIPQLPISSYSELTTPTIGYQHRKHIWQDHSIRCVPWVRWIAMTRHLIAVNHRPLAVSANSRKVLITHSSPPNSLGFQPCSFSCFWQLD